jgi:hypothetical protein
VEVCLRSIFCESVRKAVLLGMVDIVLDKVIVLLAMRTVCVIAMLARAVAESRSDSSLTMRIVCVIAVLARAVANSRSDSSGVVSVTSRVVKVTVTRGTSDMVVVAVTLSLANSSETACGASTNVLGHTIKGVVAFLATAERTTLASKLAHGHGWQRSSVMVRRLVVVNLMDRYSGVDNVGLNCLLLYNRLDGLVDVVVDMLAADRGRSALAVCGSINLPLILEASLLINKVPLGGVVIAVVELAMLDGAKFSSVLLREHFAILNWLDGAVVVILVNLLIHSSQDFLVLVGLHNLVLYSRGNCLVDSGVVVTRLGHEVGDGCLGLFHFNWYVVFGICLLGIGCSRYYTR